MSDTTEVEVGPKGRVVIPAAVRRELGIEQGSRLTVLVDAGAVVFVPRDHVRRRLKAMFAGLPTSMSRQLLRERRLEARREAEQS
jgi:AbrB family looped-hinge helix DNA binding protein